jgi:CheY-like chemotaxis protein
VTQEKRSILVVDGSASFIVSPAMLLKNLDYVVQSATTAEDALAKIAKSAPAVVITDTALPGTSGLDLLNQIKKSESLHFIPVIVHSSLADPSVKDECTDAGCAAFFCKPAAPEALFEAIQAATEATPRHHIRINTALQARIARVRGHPESEPTEEVTQLSEGGLYVKTRHPAAKGAVLPVTLLMKNREIRVNAVVLYICDKPGGLQGPGMGMKFTDLNASDLNYIREFIRQHVLSTIVQD